MRLLLIDGHYYVYRSFFAIPNLSNSRGEPTNAIFGFTKTLRLMVKHLQPELGAVVWDEGLPQKRVELQPAYKETRKEMPKPMVPSSSLSKKLTPCWASEIFPFRYRGRRPDGLLCDLSLQADRHGRGTRDQR
jgi:DNA polymerase-1